MRSLRKVCVVIFTTINKGKCGIFTQSQDFKDMLSQPTPYEILGIWLLGIHAL